MSEYGSGITAGRAFSYDKERIRKALDCQIIAGEDENGFIFEPCTPEQAHAEILRIYDNAVYQCLQAAHSGRALEKIARDTGWKMNLKDYQKALQETCMTEEYRYEGDED